jgi:hypothetical protein
LTRLPRLCVRDRPGPARCPEVLCPVKALPLPGRRLAPPQRASPLLLRSYDLMRQTKTLPPPTGVALVGGSLQVAASPCWEMALPDVISASLSLDARAPVTAVCGVHIPVSSPASTAFPVLSQVGSPANTHPSDFTVEGNFATAAIPLCSGLQVCLPHRSLPPLRTSSAGRPWRLRPSRTYVVTNLCIGYASPPNRAIEGAGTSTPLDSRPCRPLR